MRLIDFDGCVAISQTSIPNKMEMIVGRFFFTRDVIKSWHFISDETDVT